MTRRVINMTVFSVMEAQVRERKKLNKYEA